MTTAESIYLALVILCGGIYLMSLALFHFMILPGAEDPGVLYLIVAFLWVMVLTLSGTVGINIYSRSLLTIPTVVQCVALCLTVYFIPIAIWGAILL